MKRIILLTGLVAILFASCEREHKPVANFSVSNSYVFIGDQVYFNNLSHYAGRCEWDFGDGTTSLEFNPVHQYTNKGTYTVRLTVYNDGFVEYAFANIDVTGALFTTSYSLVIPNELVFFNNLTPNADEYEWDFGDGYFSTEANPSHFFRKEGKYNVRLTAINSGIVDYYTSEITVYYTTLEVEVREFVTNELIPDVEITLYETYDDWYDLVNPLINGFTDENGIVIFKNLGTYSYYIDAYSTFYDNEQLGFDDIGFIETLPLQYATHNIFVALVDYYPEGKANDGNLKSTERVRKPVIREIKRVYKERVKADK